MPPFNRLAAVALLRVFYLSLAACLPTVDLAAVDHEAQIDEHAAKPRFSGIVPYHIYEDKEIQNGSRGNFITTSPNNTLFFSNEMGIHTFDGSSWYQLLETDATRDKIRSLHWVDGQVYAAGYGSVGRLTFDVEDGVRYERINSQPITNNAAEFYHQIHESGPWLYFIGMGSMVAFNRETGNLDSHSFGAWVEAAYVKDGNLHVATDSGGLLKRQDGAFHPLPAFAEFVESRRMSAVAISPDDHVVFATEDGKLYQIIDERPVPLDLQFDLANASDILDIAFLDESRFAVVIAGSGIHIMNLNGRALARLDKQLDYRWAAARALHLDRQGTLWVMFNATIGKVLVNNPITAIDERLRPSFNYPIPRFHKGDLYIQNNGGLLRPLHDSRGLLRGFEDVMSDEALALSLVEAARDGMYVHAEETTYIHRDGELTPLARPGRMNRLVGFPDDPDRLLGLTNTDIKLLEREGDTLRVTSEVTQPVGWINRIAYDRDGVFWLEIGLGRVGKVWLENNQLQLRLYDGDDGLPSDWVALWDHEGRVQFTERTGVYLYQPETDRFVKSDALEPYFPRERGSLQRVATDPYGNVWASYNFSNHILWKQPNGSYLKDSQSLAHLGQLYLSHFLFVENGDALLFSATELFHFDASIATRNRPLPSPNIAEVSNVEGNRKHYINPGFEYAAPSMLFTPDTKGIAVRIASPFSSTLKQPSFQYMIEGLSKEWSKWNASNELFLSNLDPGEYRLHVRARIGDITDFSQVSLPFTLQPSFHQTTFAFFLYFIGGIAIVFAGYQYFSRSLKSDNEKLERMVTERTREIESKNVELEKQAETLEAKNLMLADQSELLQRKAEEVTEMLNQLRAAQDQIMTASRKAGMAEVATNVLHNVGNVLNSINVTVLRLANSLDIRRIERLVRLSQIIDSHRSDLASFFTQDPKGKAIPDYLKNLSSVLNDDFIKYHLEIDALQDNIDHVKTIIATQQAHAMTVDVNQEILLPELIDSAITMILSDVEQSNYFQVRRTYEPGLRIVSDKHRILQILANFVKNAKEAINEAQPERGRIDIVAHFDKARRNVQITVTDNGVGIQRDNLGKIFTHGFTTKSEGHGFGMHSCANSAKILGGTISIDSSGVGHGATVTLTLPAIALPAEKQVRGRRLGSVDVHVAPMQNSVS